MIPKSKFSITTNGTIINESILNFIAEEYDHLSISIDGIKEAHDKNRVYKNKQGSFDVVQKNALKLLDRRPDIIARMTVNSSNVSYLYEGVMELIHMGFVNIMPTPDGFDTNWNDASFDEFLTQCKKLASYLNRTKELNNNIDIGFVNDAPMKTKNSVCDGGITTIVIDTDGKIYPCIMANGNKEFCIGDIFQGINEDDLQKVHSEDHMVLEECMGCERYHHCTSTRCKIINKLITGDSNMPSGVQCCLEHIFVKSAEYSRELQETK